MFYVYLVGFTFIFAVVPFCVGFAGARAVRAEYRRFQGNWPQAKWIAGLELTILLGLCLSAWLIAFRVFLTSVGNPPLYNSTGARWALVTALVIAIGGPTLLLIFILVGLVIVQRYRYGMPHRNPPA